MGDTTDFFGYFDIEPALNEGEIEYLMAFSASRRFDRIEGPYAVPGNPYAVVWLRYLLKNFLASKAYAVTNGGKMFADFTFDHVLNGTIAASRRDNREMFLIKGTPNRVVKKVLREGDPMFGDLADLPYELEIDRVLAERSKRRRAR